MADRILTWYIEAPVGDGLTQGPVFILDRDYSLPGKVRLHAKRLPDSAPMRIDIKQNGTTSIFNAIVGRQRQPSTPNLAVGGLGYEEDWDDFLDSVRHLNKYDRLSLDFLDSGGAKGITVVLELDEAEGIGDVPRDGPGSPFVGNRRN